MGLEKVKKLNIVNNVHIRHHSYVDIVGLLKAIPIWFNQMGYFFYEKAISEKDIGSGDELESEWVATKEVTEYVKFTIELKIDAKDIRKLVLESGEETYWARVLIILTAVYEKDFQGKYASNWYGEFMRQFYERFLVDEELKKYIGKIIMESIDLRSVMKEYLK